MKNTTGREGKGRGVKGGEERECACESECHAVVTFIVHLDTLNFIVHYGVFVCLASPPPPPPPPPWPASKGDMRWVMQYLFISVHSKLYVFLWFVFHLFFNL